MIREAIMTLSQKKDLSYDVAETVMNEIMSGEASDIQMSAYLTALAMQGETLDEITASAAGMRSHCVRLLNDMDVLEIVGTGGDQSNSFNISTTSAIVIAAGGVPVAKHGNRAASSKSGAADVLEALGVNIMVSPAKSAQMLKDINICFLFAQKYHTAMRYVAHVRKELGIRTVFNILGPLSNPAGASMQVMGVYEEELVEPLARVLANLGVKNALVVYGQDRLDEISMSAKTSVCEIRDGNFCSYEIEPEQFGFEKCKKEELAGGTPEENAQIDALTEIVKRYDPTGLITGEGVMTKDLSDITTVDIQVTNMLSIAAILLIVAICFKSVTIPIVLVAAIELAIFINQGIPALTGTVIPFISPIVIGCIQLGATVDYAILMTTRFREELENGLDRVSAIKVAATASDKSIITSASVFFCANIGVSLISKIEIIKSLCSMLARGAIISALISIFILPSILLVCERFFARTSHGWPKTGAAGKSKLKQEESI